MNLSPGLPSPLVDALKRYVEARHIALVAARLALGINDLDARALLYIAAHPDARPSHLRDYLGITSAGVTTLIDRLVERGAVGRDVDPVDRRVIRLSTTVDLAVEPWSVLNRFDDAFLGAIDDEDLEDTARMAAALDRYTTSASRAFD